MTGVVKQLNDVNGTVVSCTAADRCKKENCGDKSIPSPKKCLLPVDHGQRCKAWDNESTTWLIHEDPKQISQLR